ncbi:loganic acid O-methyltransferase-like isoform X2 [Malania oleifera]|uniref:loganic acid O-methyltransferase-like isoform X2 n=1 Tax=Malania oleifera TaxID=397392 RepID=UPI0025AE5C91|nr:loganic acid O-methyltransferase-like isoform X2 [Malania oleifera]
MSKEAKNLSEPQPKLCTTSGADSPYSYAENSSYQKGVLDAAKDIIAESIWAKLDLKNASFDPSSPFRIADLGCSAGPNTFIAVQNIIEAVKHKYQSAEHQVPEFQVFFNDHADNDFNTLFRSLPRTRDYTAAGVPGSFHGRLFPKSSLHLVHSSYALHWLSRVPVEVGDRSSPAFNRGSVHSSGFVREVAEAYSAQYSGDMEAFLRCRAEEVVGGGLMLLILLALPDGILSSQTTAGMTFDLVANCLRDMAKAWRLL